MREVADQELTFPSNGGSADQRNPAKPAKLVQFPTGFEIVTAIDQHIHLGKIRLRGPEPGNAMGMDPGLHLVEGFSGGFNFQAVEVRLPEQDLTLQVGQINPVTIDENDFTQTGCNQIEGNRATEATAANHCNPTRLDSSLALYIKFWKQDLPAVAKQIPIIHCGQARAPRSPASFLPDPGVTQST